MAAAATQVVEGNPPTRPSQEHAGGLLPLAHRRKGMCGLRVVELGAGTGLAGILAASLGADVLLTDLPHVLPNLQGNAAVNREAVVCGGGWVRVEVLRWGERGDGEAVLRQMRGEERRVEGLEGECMKPSNGGQPGDAGGGGVCEAVLPQEEAARHGGSPLPPALRRPAIDVILAADVVYYDSLFQPLLDTLLQLTEGQACARMASDAPAGMKARAPGNEDEVLINEGGMLREGDAGEGTREPGGDVRRKVNRCVPRSSHTLNEGLTVDAPVILLAHLRRWKKDARFFRQAGRHFHVQLVYSHPPPPGCRDGVKVYMLTPLRFVVPQQAE